jgi:hypothetical protein
MPYIVFQVKRAIGGPLAIVANANNRIEVRDQGNVLREIVNSPDATPPTGEVPVRRFNGTIITKVPYWTIQQNPPPILLPATPGVAITSPAAPVIVDVLDTVLLQATCTLNGSPSSASTVVWSSNLDGQLGVGESVSTDALTVGVHTITASFTSGTTATDTETVTVINASAPPVVTILSPSDSGTFEYGAAIKCTATAEDIVNGNLSSSIKWYRNTAAGLLYEGATFDLAGLPPGQHIIRATCNDNETPPNQGQDTVTVYVSQGTFGLNGLALQDEVVIGRQSYGGQVTQ